MKLRFKQVKNRQAWVEPKLVANYKYLLDKELSKRKDIKEVFMCLTTDPFMYQNSEICKASLYIINRLNEENIPVRILTKGVLPGDEIPALKNADMNTYGITYVSDSEMFREQFEPHAAPLHERLSALRNLHFEGLKTWVCCEPYPPPQMISQNICDVLNNISFTDEIVFGRLNYGKSGENAEFYAEAQETVKDFCERSAILLRVKTSPSETVKIT